MPSTSTSRTPSLDLWDIQIEQNEGEVISNNESDPSDDNSGCPLCFAEKTELLL